MNILMALIQLASGITYSSVWFYSLAGYYFFLVLIRFLVLNCEVTTKEARDVIVEFKRYKLCGILLIPMNFLLAVIVFLIVIDDMGFSYSIAYTIGLTLMTVIFTCAAITNVIRYRKYNSPVLSAAKVTSLIAAFVSMLSLETALFSAFGEKENEFVRRIVTSVSGATVLAVTLIMAVYMIKHADYSIAALEEEDCDI
ncbi:MAG: hypothetical protein K6F63_07850 [Lachnospiraceae bacterium]|nr:hypothetical protein [Lachnospiraceae bacterium]